MLIAIYCINFWQTRENSNINKLLNRKSMMKKWLLTLCMLLGVVSTTWADLWTGPVASQNDFPGEMTLAGQITFLDTGDNRQSNTVQIAAFIDGECRAVTTVTREDGADQAKYSFLVRGFNSGDESDEGKTVSVKALYNGLIYEFTQTVNFQMNGQSLSLTLNPLLGVKLPSTISIESETLPTTYDLSNAISYTYAESENPTPMTPGQLTLAWDYSSSSSYIASVNENNILTTTAIETPAAGVSLTLTITGKNYTDVAEVFSKSDITKVIVKKANIPVESVSLSTTEITAKVGDQDIWERLDDLKSKVTVLPSNASNKEVTWSVRSDEEAWLSTTNSLVLLPGTFHVDYKSVSNPSIMATLTVVVTAPVTNIVLSPKTLNLKTGQNLEEQLANVTVTVVPDNATNKTVNHGFDNEEERWVEGGIISKNGTWHVIYSSESDPDVTAKLTVKVTTDVTSIVLDPTNIAVEVGANIDDALAGVNVTVLPSTASNKAYTNNLSDIIADGEWIDENHLVTTPGNYSIVYKSTSNPEVTATLTVSVGTPVSFTYADEVSLSLLRDATLRLTNVVGDDFDVNKITIETEDKSYTGDDPFVVKSVGSKSIILRGHFAGDWSFSVLYDGKAMKTAKGKNKGTAHIVGEIVLPTNNWAWVSLPYMPKEGGVQKPISLMKNDTEMADFMENIVEVRSQTSLLYNDESLGLFGDITELKAADGMYKVRAKGGSENIINLGSNVFLTRNLNPKQVKKGYNWLNNPNEFNVELSELQTQLSASAHAGDMLIGQNSSAIFDESTGSWVGTDFKLEAGKGYIYYAATNASAYPDLKFKSTNPIAYRDVANARNMSPRHFWTLKNEGFANNMPIVATISGLDHPENYVVGAFVGDECRGEGYVAVRDVILINVAGTMGEKVSFRLKDMEMDEEIDITEQVNYCNMIGSMNQPLLLTIPGVTGITTVSTKADKSDVYSISGQKLNSPRKGINIVGGKKIVY